MNCFASQIILMNCRSKNILETSFVIIFFNDAAASFRTGCFIKRHSIKLCFGNFPKKYINFKINLSIPMPMI